MDQFVFLVALCSRLHFALGNSIYVSEMLINPAKKKVYFRGVTHVRWLLFGDLPNVPQIERH